MHHAAPAPDPAEDNSGDVAMGNAADSAPAPEDNSAPPADSACELADILAAAPAPRPSLGDGAAGGSSSAMGEGGAGGSGGVLRKRPRVGVEEEEELDMAAEARLNTHERAWKLYREACEFSGGDPARCEVFKNNILDILKNPKGDT